MGVDTNKNWVEIAHKLKGSASLIGAQKLTDLCMEGQALEKGEAAERQALYQSIQNECRQVQDYLNSLKNS